MTLALLFLLLGLAGGGAVGAVAHRKVAAMIPIRTPSNKLRLDNRTTDVSLVELDLTEIKTRREIEQQRMNMENDRLEGEVALEKMRLGHAKTMLELETAEGKVARPELVLGDAIRSRRQEARLTQAALAGHAGVRAARIGLIENGDGGTVEEMRQLCYQLDLRFEAPRATPYDRVPDFPWRRRALAAWERQDAETADAEVVDA